MKTLRLLRNLAALFMFGAVLVVSSSSAGLAGSHHAHCAERSLPYNCTKDGNSCSTALCASLDNCNFSICVLN
jgi:hypothetical protein